jgi:hypothetical protein
VHQPRARKAVAIGTLRLTRHSLEGVREGANFLITKKPRYLRDRQSFVSQVALREINSQIGQDSCEGQPLRRKPPSERSLTHAKLASDLAHLSFSVG